MGKCRRMHRFKISHILFFLLALFHRNFAFHLVESHQEVFENAFTLRLCGLELSTYLESVELIFVPNLEKKKHYEIDLLPERFFSFLDQKYTHHVILRRVTEHYWPISTEGTLAVIGCRNISSGQIISLSAPVTVARIVAAKKPDCTEHLPNKFENATPGLSELLIKVRSYCLPVNYAKATQLGVSQWLSLFAIKINSVADDLKFQSHDLASSQFHSLSILQQLVPPLLILDGTNVQPEEAVVAIEQLLSRHSVLQLVWEPFLPQHARVWILAPHVSPMPALLLAMLDYTQWQSNLVRNASYYRSLPLCTKDNANCEPGCPGTTLSHVFGSGFSADLQSGLFET